MGNEIDKNKKKRARFGIKTKLILSFSSIVAILLISSLISILEFRKMSNYVSEMIEEDVSRISSVRDLSDELRRYNSDILTVIGIDELTQQPAFDYEAFAQRCDSLRISMQDYQVGAAVDSIKNALQAYMTVSLELPTVLSSDFISSRGWYFERLQPFYNDLMLYVDQLTSVIYEVLGENSESFDSGFYRSIMPGMVAVGAGILLTLMLLFFILSYYVKPVLRMQSSLEDFINLGRPYSCPSEAEDQFSDLNNDISEICSQNQQLSRRIKQIKHNNNVAADEHKDNQ